MPWDDDDDDDAPSVPSIDDIGRLPEFAVPVPARIDSPVSELARPPLDEGGRAGGVGIRQKGLSN
jgi:hypothetical protein